jgi:hypothetical protein
VGFDFFNSIPFLLSLCIKKIAVVIETEKKKFFTINVNDFFSFLKKDYLLGIG